MGTPHLDGDPARISCRARINPLVVQTTFVCGAAILTEAALGFLGLGFPPEIPSLGSILAEGRPFFQRAPWVDALPGDLPRHC